MVLSSSPIAKPTTEERAARPLAYQQAIAERNAAEAEAEPKAKADETKNADIPPFETVTSEPEPAAGVDAAETPEQDMTSLPDESADAQDGLDDWPGEGTDSSQDLAALPPGQAAPYDAEPPMPGAADQGYTDDAEQWATSGARHGPTVSRRDKVIPMRPTASPAILTRLLRKVALPPKAILTDHRKTLNGTAGNPRSGRIRTPRNGLRL
ncbi:hypothetical protein [Methyloceanibacter superfactus]|nr:hypothetical protein [Methyloceanibacter superfactus]